MVADGEEQASVAAQPLTDADPDLSPWWLRTALIVLVVGFTCLISITMLAYRNAPPIKGYLGVRADAAQMNSLHA